MKRFELLKVAVVPAVSSTVIATPTDELGYLAGLLTLAFMVGGYFTSMYR